MKENVIIMQSFKTSFKQRTKRFIAEDKCKEYLTKNNIMFTRYGFDALFDIPWQKFNLIPKLLRNTPDFMVITDKASLLEVKGCRDILRLKLDDMDSYREWNKICRLMMFLYSTLDNNPVIISYEKLEQIAFTCETDIYPENQKEYYKIPWQLIQKEIK